MKWLQPISKVFISSAVLLLVIWLLLKDRGCNPPDHSGDLQFVQEQKRLRDSAHNSDRVKAAKFSQDSARMQKSVDTLKTQLSVTKKMLNNSQAKAAELASDFLISKHNNDTAGYKQSAEGMAVEIFALNGIIDHYEVLTENLFDTVVKMKDETAKRLGEERQLYSDMKYSFDSVTTEYLDLHKDYKKVAGKAGKKYAVGIGGGAGITTNGKPAGLIGITISRTLFRL